MPGFAYMLIHISYCYWVPRFNYNEHTWIHKDGSSRSSCRGVNVDDEVAKALSRAGIISKAPSIACSDWTSTLNVSERLFFCALVCKIGLFE